MKSIKVLNKIRSLASEPMKGCNTPDDCTYVDTCYSGSPNDVGTCSAAYDYCNVDYTGCQGGATDSCYEDHSSCGYWQGTDICFIDWAGCPPLVGDYCTEDGC